MPSVSVVMPVFNSEKTVRRAIESILNQTFIDFEFLIIDDGSSDKSIQIVESFEDERIQFYKNSINIGSLKSRNFLFTKVKGEFIAFQDADDFSEKNRLEKLYTHLNENINCYICGSNAKVYNYSGTIVSVTNKPTNDKEIKEAFKESIPIIFATCMIKREVLAKIGVFRYYFFDKGNYDYDWMIRISERFQCSNIKEPLYNIIRSKVSNSINIKNPHKLIGDKIVRFLANERANGGKDSLMLEDYEKLEDYCNKEVQLYLKDNTLFMKQRMYGLLSENMTKEALLLSVKIFINKPNMKNLKNTLHLVKRIVNVFQTT